VLTLYSFGPRANSMKPLLALYEKGLPFKWQQLNPAKFEHHEDWFKAINPNGQVPALVDDGKVITESTVICEYLEDQYPTAVSLRPADAFGRAQMRVWTKWVDEYFCWCVSTIGWERVVKPMARALSDADFEEHVKKIPIPEQQTKWRNARTGFPQAVLDEEMRKIGVSFRKLEARLAHNTWLAGEQYTLADICNYAIAIDAPMIFPELANTRDTPQLVDWLKRMDERPAVKHMMAECKLEFTPQKAAG
jgi:glutathione S-transferase